MYASIMRGIALSELEEPKNNKKSKGERKEN